MIEPVLREATEAREEEREKALTESGADGCSRSVRGRLALDGLESGAVLDMNSSEFNRDESTERRSSDG